jgi:hypothetical protein
MLMCQHIASLFAEGERIEVRGLNSLVDNKTDP